MKIKKIIKGFLLTILTMPFVYVMVSLLLSMIIQNGRENSSNCIHEIYLASNGVHLDIIIPKKYLDSFILSNIIKADESYYSFGWGDENFYINTPNWSDLKITTAFSVAFLRSSSLMHVSRYKDPKADWLRINISESELLNLNLYLKNSFRIDSAKRFEKMNNLGYYDYDDFYRANGSYSFHNTCNSWVNRGFYESGIPCCFWTPFDFTLLNIFEE